MNELIPICTATLQQETIPAVNARDLHEFLEVKTRFNDWISTRVSEYDFIENQDFVLITEKSVTKGRGGDRRSRSYHVSLDMAKELSMVERNAKGKQARLYFIECERRAKSTEAKSASLDPRNLSRMQLIQLALDAETERLALEQQVTELAPKAQFHDAVTEAINCQTIQEISKVFGIGSNRMFKWMREEKILMSNNQPYQRYIDAGYFKVVEKCFRDERGERNTYTRTLVTGKGLAYIHKRLQAPLPLAMAA